MMTDYKELYLLLLYYFSNIFARLTLISVSLDKSFLLELLSNENDRTYHNGDACRYLVQSSHIRFFGRYRPKEQGTGG